MIDMVQAVGRLEGTWGREVTEGLRRFAELPDWLAAMKDSELVAQALVRWVPELRDGRQELRECEVLRVRLRDGAWAGQYAVRIEEGAEVRTVKLNGLLHVHGDAGSAPASGSNDEAFASEEWSCYAPELRLEFRLLPADAALVSLPALTDPEAARLLLERGMRQSSPAYADLRIEGCTPRVMRYKPGRRCTVLYDLNYPAEAGNRGWPDPVVAKTHHGIKGRNADASMRALWDSPLRNSPNVTVAEPLGFLPEANVVLQGPIKEEMTLKNQLRVSLRANTSEELHKLVGYLEKTGRGLADLHGCGVTVGKTETFEGEMAEVRGRVARLADYVGDLADAAEPLLSRLESIAAACPADPVVPSHRSFRPAQVLIHGRDIGFIDFDSFSQAEPALDLSLFLSVLRDLSLRALQERDGRPTQGEPVRSDHLLVIDELSSAFLEAYEGTAAVQLSRERVDLWHALEVFSRVVNCWTKDRPERLQHCMQLLTHLYAKHSLTELVA